MRCGFLARRLQSQTSPIWRKTIDARDALINELSESQQGLGIADDLRNDFSKPEETLASILAFVDNYLAPFLNPWIAEVFCAEQPTFSFDQLDDGKLLCISIPPSFQAERIYINTFLKFGAYMHLQMRFQQIEAIEEKNMIFIFADEGQEVVTAAESAFADHRQLATIREAKGCFVLATQTYESLTTALGKDRADVLVANLVTHIIFKCATKETSEWAATSIGDRNDSGEIASPTIVAAARFHTGRLTNRSSSRTNSGSSRSLLRSLFIPMASTGRSSFLRYLQRRATSRLGSSPASATWRRCTLSRSFSAHLPASKVHEQNSLQNSTPLATTSASISAVRIM